MPWSFKASGKVECVASLPIPSSPHFSIHSVKLRSFIELFYRPAPSLLYWLGKCSQYYNNQRSCSRVFLFHDLRMSPSPRSAISLTHNFKTTSLILCKTPLCCDLYDVLCLWVLWVLWFCRIDPPLISIVSANLTNAQSYWDMDCFGYTLPPCLWDVQINVRTNFPLGPDHRIWILSVFGEAEMTLTFFFIL